MGERVLLAGGTEKSRELLQTLAAPGSWECCKLCHSGGETRRALGEGEWSLLIINTPLATRADWSWPWRLPDAPWRRCCCW